MMKFYFIADEVEESVVVRARSKNDKVIAIEKIVNDDKHKINAYKNKEVYIFNIDEVICFFTNNNKINIYVDNEIYMLKYRMYQIETLIDDNFIKINQGCIVNKQYIKKFTFSIAGSIKVVLNNGFEDYISRRELTKVKRSLGI